MNVNMDQEHMTVSRRTVLRAAATGAAALAATRVSADGAHPVADSITEMPAIELRDAIRAGKVSCREVMTAFLARIDAVNPAFNAIVSLESPEELLALAEKADAALRRGEEVGPLHGLPMAPKDAVQVAGMRTTLGSVLFKNNMPKDDGLLAARLRAAGAIFVGRTNMPEFGLGSQTYNSLFGTTRNAWNRKLTAGGSSGGAATALAQRLLPVADGSDMMGSLRNPAGWNNIYSLRPSFGRVPYWPSSEVFFSQLATEGPMGRTVADVALLLSVMAGPDDRVPLSINEAPVDFTATLAREFKGTRIGFLGDFNGYLPMEAGVIGLCENALQHFRNIGCIVEEATTDFDMPALWRSWLAMRSHAISSGFARMYQQPQMRDKIKPEAIWEIETGLALSGLDVAQAATTRSAWYQAVRTLLEQFDFLVLPTAQVFPFAASVHWPKEIAGHAMDTYHRWMEVAGIGTLSALPIGVVPAGFDTGNRAMGLQILGKYGGDLEILQLAHAYDQASGFSRLIAP